LPYLPRRRPECATTSPCPGTGPPADRTQEAKREAASFAAHRALVDLFPTEATAAAKLMSDLGYDPADGGPEGSPSAVGVQAARAVLAFRHGDGANQLGDLGPEPRGLAGAYGDWTELPAGQGGAGLGRSWARPAAHQGRGVAALPRHPAVRRVPLGALDLQRHRGAVMACFTGSDHRSWRAAADLFAGGRPGRNPA
jgi:hypothetical protein